MENFKKLLNHIEIAKSEMEKCLVEVQGNLNKTSLEDKMFIAKNVLPVIGDKKNIKDISDIDLNDFVSPNLNQTVIEAIKEVEDYYSDSYQKGIMLHIVLNFYIKNKLSELSQ